MKRARGVSAFAASAALGMAILVIAATSASTAASPPAPTGRNQDVRQLVRILGVLRRTQRPSDRDAALVRGLTGGFRPVRSLMRLADTTNWGQKIFLVPFTPKHPQTGLVRTASGLAVITAAGGACCDTAHDVVNGEAYLSGYRPDFLVLVVPDRVASIAITLRAGSGSHHPLVIRAAVHHNVAAFLTPFSVTTVVGHTLKWYGSSGQLLRRLRP